MQLRCLKTSRLKGTSAGSASTSALVPSLVLCRVNSRRSLRAHATLTREAQDSVLKTSTACVSLQEEDTIKVVDSRKRPEQQVETGELGFNTDFFRHYDIYEREASDPLGQGQYGVVYRAENVASKRPVAVKFMPKTRGDRTREEHLQLIKQEVHLLKTCQDCPHVVKLEGVYEDEHFVYLVVELCEGGDLRHVLERGRLTEQEAALVMRAVLDVIHHCHSNHYVYGDCKPANFLLRHPSSRHSKSTKGNAQSSTESAQQKCPPTVAQLRQTEADRIAEEIRQHVTKHAKQRLVLQQHSDHNQVQLSHHHSGHSKHVVHGAGSAGSQHSLHGHNVFNSNHSNGNGNGKQAEISADSGESFPASGDAGNAVKAAGTVANNIVKSPFEGNHSMKNHSRSGSPAPGTILAESELYNTYENITTTIIAGLEPDASTDLHMHHSQGKLRPSDFSIVMLQAGPGCRASCGRLAPAADVAWSSSSSQRESGSSAPTWRDVIRNAACIWIPLATRAGVREAINTDSSAQAATESAGNSKASSQVESVAEEVSNKVTTGPVERTGQAALQADSTQQANMVVLATDFGCSQPIKYNKRGQPLGVTRKMGSPVYMAPECWGNAGMAVGMAVDIFAAGVMLYQLISGRYPFWSMSPEDIDKGRLATYNLMVGIQNNPVLFNTEPWANVSDRCKHLIHAMLEKQPSDRITAADALKHPWFKEQLGYTPTPSAPTQQPQHAATHTQQQQQCEDYEEESTTSWDPEYYSSQV